MLVNNKNAHKNVLSHFYFNLHLLITNGVEHLFMCLFIIHPSFLENCLLKYFNHVCIVFFVLLLLNCKGSLYVQDTRPLPNRQIFFSTFSLLSLFHNYVFEVY